VGGRGGGLTRSAAAIPGYHSDYVGDPGLPQRLRFPDDDARATTAITFPAWRRGGVIMSASHCSRDSNAAGLLTIALPHRKRDKNLVMGL